MVTNAAGQQVPAFESANKFFNPKSKMYSEGAAETNLEFKKWLRRQRDCFKEGGLSWLRTTCQEGELYIGPPSVEALKQKRWRIIADTLSPQPGYALTSIKSVSST